jgi:DNA polymerase III alpha subunit
MSALGLTDHNLLTGAVEFVTACRAAGIQPILGLEIDLEQQPFICWQPASRAGPTSAG